MVCFSSSFEIYERKVLFNYVCLIKNQNTASDYWHAAYLVDKVVFRHRLDSISEAFFSLMDSVILWWSTSTHRQTLNLYAAFSELNLRWQKTVNPLWKEELEKINALVIKKINKMVKAKFRMVIFLLFSSHLRNLNLITEKPSCRVSISSHPFRGNWRIVNLTFRVCLLYYRGNQCILSSNALPYFAIPCLPCPFLPFCTLPYQVIYSLHQCI